MITLFILLILGFGFIISMLFMEIYELNHDIDYLEFRNDYLKSKNDEYIKEIHRLEGVIYDR